MIRSELSIFPASFIFVIDYISSKRNRHYVFRQDQPGDIPAIGNLRWISLESNKRVYSELSPRFFS